VTILHQCDAVMRQGGYLTRLSSGEMTLLAFEDEVVMGFIAEFVSVDEIISRWENIQHSFLAAQGKVLSQAPRKSWNIYSVFLTLDTTNPLQDRLTLIEEDLRGTRKIARVCQGDQAGIERALLPLLPMLVRTGTTQIGPEAALAAKLDKAEAAYLRYLQTASNENRSVLDQVLEEGA
jgi:hypothetical protein